MPVLECSRCNELYYSAHGSTELACDVCGGGTWRLFEDEVSFARVAGLARHPRPGDHAALVYTDPHDAVDFCAAYLGDGLRRGERPVLSVPQVVQDEVLSRLPPEQLDSAVILEAERIYGPDFDPERVGEEYAQKVREVGGPVRLLCGPDGDAAAGIDGDQWRRYERIAHELVLELGHTVLCVYDGRRLPTSFSPVAVETHPLICREGGELKRNPDFRYSAAG
jgi:MEDS: MEthanogen/methylotroph, DcmR Sensory domain